MKKFMIYLSILIISNIYAQCDDYSQTQCSNDNNCEWVEDIETVTCASLVWDEELCEAAPECTYSCDDGNGYFGWCDPSCYGGMTFIDNSYCQEIQIPECSEMSETQCDTNEHCSWVEDVDYIDCDDLSDYNSCNINYDNGCQWILMHWQQQNETNFCTGPTFEVNNSYCYDSESLDCYQMHENQCENNDDCEWYFNTNSNNCNQFNSNLECSNYDGCDWAQDSITASCYSNQWESGFANSAECNAIPGCYWDCSDWYSWASDQSMSMESRDVFLKKIKEFETKYSKKDTVPRPPHWSGWRIVPREIEFWLDGEGRIHERLNYIFKKDKWEKELLYP